MSISISIESIEKIIQCLYSIAGLTAIIGAVNVCVVMYNDERNVWKSIAKTTTAIVALCGAAAALQSVLS